MKLSRGERMRIEGIALQKECKEKNLSENQRLNRFAQLFARHLGVFSKAGAIQTIESYITIYTLDKVGKTAISILGDTSVKNPMNRLKHRLENPLDI